ncbi:MAG: FlgO family outer membrane protein [Campylobacterota bacterium]|nr:FlgO family outer membrane protein [Campylobacterota bacterium]
MKKSLITLLLAVLTLSSFSGCTSALSPQTLTKKNCSTNAISTKKFYDVHISYNGVMDEAIDSLLSSPFNTDETNKDKLQAGEQILVTDFVDTTSLENNSKFGFVLSNNLKDSLINKHSFKVIEAEVSKYFKISGNGLKILSRDSDNMRKTTLKVTRVVAGTYTYTDEELVIFVKLINLKTGIIEGSYARTLPMTCEVMEMLH